MKNNPSIRLISNEKAILFLKENHARKENVFVRPSEKWGGFFFGDELVSVIGINRKKNHVSFSSSFTKPEYRWKGCGYVMLLWALNQVPGEKVISYANPRFYLLEKILGYQELQTLKNGTKKTSFISKGGYDLWIYGNMENCIENITWTEK